MDPARQVIPPARAPRGAHHAPSVRHIVWDWNGTLFHDVDAVVAATNAAFAAYGRNPLTADDFRAAFTRPVWLAYEKLLGRPLVDGEWLRLDAGYHAQYHVLMAACGLTAGARGTLQIWQSIGGSQSLLSMWEHERLVPTVHGFRIDPFFARVDGLRDGSPGGRKAAHLIAHLAAMRLDPAGVLVVGDSVDDIEAAHQVGAKAVAFTGGTTSRAALHATGAPVVDSLADALNYA